MIGRLAIVSGSACLIFGALLAVELMAKAETTEFPPAATPQPPGVERPGDHRAAIDHADIIRQIAARPLFSASRKPAAESRHGTSVAAAAAVFSRKLTGVVLEPKMRAAVFAGAGKERGMLVLEGETIEGWTLESVTPVNVTVRNGRASQVVELPKITGAGASKPARLGVPAFTSPAGNPSLRRDH